MTDRRQPWQKWAQGLIVTILLGGVIVVTSGFIRGCTQYVKNQGDEWKAFDKNHDGVFTWKELQDMYDMTKAKFAFYDANADGRVTREEFELEAMGNKEKLVARGLELLRKPNKKTLLLIDVFETGRTRSIHRMSDTDFFWQDPRFSEFKIDSDRNDIITETELRDFVKRKEEEGSDG